MWKFFSFRRVVLFFVLPVSLFLGTMVATAGTAVWPPLTALATPLICPGEIAYESQSWSYRPGQQGISRSIYCVEGGAREDITMSAIGVSFLVYSAIAFLVLGLLALAMRGRFRRAGEGPDLLRAFGINGPTHARAPESRVDVGSILAMVSEAVERGTARVVVRDVTVGDAAQVQPEDTDPAERLAQLKRLLDQGLISGEDYEAKKAEILSAL
jgi:hypothetical protein